jgi:hypothetical protein
MKRIVRLVLLLAVLLFALVLVPLSENSNG